VTPTSYPEGDFSGSYSAILTKVSDDPPGCAAQLPNQTSESFRVYHDPETGDIRIISSQGSYRGTLDEEDCLQDTLCITDQPYYCPFGCTSTLVACFIERDPALLQGSVTTESHGEDGGPCEGPVSCQVTYDIDGQRGGGAQRSAVATGRPSPTPTDTSNRSVGPEVLEALLAGARAFLERILPGF
jgi:hypothetical protein